MKRILLLAVVLLLEASCSVTRDRMTVVHFADYSAHPDMWISPNTCTIPHTAIGEMSIDIVPGIIPQDAPEKKNTNAQEGYGNPRTGLTRYEVIRYDELLDIAVKEAKARGANGISNLSIRVDGATGTPTAYHITGLLIRVQ